jgi:Asp-tRNA(Asn)/Glu-tRNA(Gln) amidotransferase A subunit family amidase
MELQNEYDTSIDKYATKMVKVSQRSVGLPVGVQVITPPWLEERCLRIMRQIEEKAGFEIGSSRL